MSNVSTVQPQQEHHPAMGKHSASGARPDRQPAAAHRDALAAHREDCAQRPQSQHISPLLSLWLDDTASDGYSAEVVLPGEWGHSDTTESGARYGWDFEQPWRGLHDDQEPPVASPAPGGHAQLAHFISQLESSFGESFSDVHPSHELPEPPARAAGHSAHAEDAAAEPGSVGK